MLAMVLIFCAYKYARVPYSLLYDNILQLYNKFLGFMHPLYKLETVFFMSGNATAYF